MNNLGKEMWIAGFQAGATWADPVLLQGWSLERLAETRWNEIRELKPKLKNPKSR
jgi:hypothetical protein